MINLIRLYYGDNPIKVMQEDGVLYFNAIDVGSPMGFTSGSRVYKSYCPSYRLVMLRDLPDSLSRKGMTDRWRVKGEPFIAAEDLYRLFKASSLFREKPEYQTKFQNWLGSVIKTLKIYDEPKKAKEDMEAKGAVDQEATLATKEFVLLDASYKKTMSSVAIAELTGKAHRNVVRDLKVLEDQGVITLLKFAQREIYGNNNERVIYQLPFRETLILTSGYSAIQRAAIIDQWMMALDALETLEQVCESEPVEPLAQDPYAALLPKLESMLVLVGKLGIALNDEVRDGIVLHLMADSGVNLRFMLSQKKREALQREHSNADLSIEDLID